MSKQADWLDEIAKDDPDLIARDGLDAAAVGLVYRCGGPRCLCYDYEKMVGILVGRDGMTDEDARGYLDFNVVSAYVGERTPFTLFPLDTTSR